MTSKEIAEMIQRAKEAEALFDDLRDDERPVYSTLQKVGSALDELIQFAERHDLAEAGFTFFRIPELPELEVPE